MSSRRWSIWRRRFPAPDRPLRWYLGVLLAALLLGAVALPSGRLLADDTARLTSSSYRTQLIAAVAALRAAAREQIATVRMADLDAALQALPARVVLVDGPGGTYDQRPLRQGLVQLQDQAPSRTASWQAVETALVQTALDAGVPPAQLGVSPPPAAPTAPPDVQAAQSRLGADLHPAPDQPPAWLPRLLQSARDAIARFFRWVFGVGEHAAVGAPGRYAVIAGMVLLGAVALVLFVRTFERRRRRGGAGAAADAPTTWEAATADEALAQADRLAAVGDFAQALRWLHRAALGRLDEAGVLRYHAATTDWEYLARMRGQAPQLAESLRQLTDRYQWAFFGRRPADEASYQQGRVDYLQLQAALAPHHSRPGKAATA